MSLLGINSQIIQQLEPIELCFKVSYKKKQDLEKIKVSDTKKRSKENRLNEIEKIKMSEERCDISHSIGSVDSSY